MKQAGFPSKKTLESLTELDFLNHQQNLVLYGNIGVGKSHLGIALGIKDIQRQKTVYFFTVHELVNRLIDA